MSPVLVSWTDEHINKLRELSKCGLTCSEIADELKTTRNAVAGKLFRLGLCSSNKRGGTPKVFSLRARKNQAVKEIKLEAPFESRKVPFVTKGTYCKWILDEKDSDGRSMFCGNETWNKTSWCAGHARVVYWWDR